MDNLPKSVRYVKNGRGGQWWATAKSRMQVHGGWSRVPHNLLESVDLDAIEALPPEQRGTTQDFNALRLLIDRPSQHIWITFEEGCLWWCTVGDKIVANPEGESGDRGHFWLNCTRPWQRHSVGGKYLAMANLPGVVTATAGFRGTVCEPKGSNEVLRIIQDGEDIDVALASGARKAYEDAIAKLVARLQPYDFELLTDLILSRDGWARIAKLAGTTEGVDIEAQNASADEIAFVQVKSAASQNLLDDYVERFRKRRERYARMIFVVHTPHGILKTPAGEPVQVWDRKRISQLVVRHGLGDWIATRL